MMIIIIIIIIIIRITSMSSFYFFFLKSSFYLNINQSDNHIKIKIIKESKIDLFVCLYVDLIKGKSQRFSYKSTQTESTFYNYLNQTNLPSSHRKFCSD